MSSNLVSTPLCQGYPASRGSFGSSGRERAMYENALQYGKKFICGIEYFWQIANLGSKTGQGELRVQRHVKWRYTEIPRPTHKHTRTHKKPEIDKPKFDSFPTSLATEGAEEGGVWMVRNKMRWLEAE
ncbi:hypothetical protein PoB_004977400 [Plakobranchus ocellatus]|uniref:Uncharacterized protein n=1 Tax=Plakobranchus ocellatus TaxID=259542 RepID=A0AAV4BSW8_9GAST|nr:hypothetical protein PoB_004977400 [Plakobranchus ocellatus]